MPLACIPLPPDRRSPVQGPTVYDQPSDELRAAEAGGYEIRRVASDVEWGRADGANLVIPDPSLMLLVGAAGSGKSTLAARLFAPDEIVSSDALRACRICGDEADQRATAGRVPDSSTGTLAVACRHGLLTVVDATNALAAHRRPLIRGGRRPPGLPVVAIVLDLPADVVDAQNTARPRVVDPAVVDRHLASIRALLFDGPGFEVEGITRSSCWRVRRGRGTNGRATSRLSDPQVAGGAHPAAIIAIATPASTMPTSGSRVIGSRRNGHRRARRS